MRLFTSFLISTIFLVGSLTPQSALAAKTFKMNPANFSNIFQQIKTDYSYLFNDDEHADSLHTFLLNKLNMLQINPNCPAPFPRITLSTQGGLNFSWDKDRNDKSMISYFRLADGYSEEYETTTTQLTIPLFNYQYTLFTFTSQCGQKQGFVNLIIVERDIFSLQGGNDKQGENNKLSKQVSSLSPSYQSYPNPFTNQVTLVYQLEHEQELFIELRSIDGRLMLPVIEKGRMMKGRYEEELDLSGFPAGIYFCRIQGDSPHNIRLVKKE